MGTEKEPRDFLTEASGWMGTPRPLRDMLDSDRQYTYDKILQILRDGSTYERKYAAFSLGQIGDPAAISYLEKTLATESVPGVREAVAAALSALRAAPSNKGFSELQRRRIIEEEYNRR